MTSMRYIGVIILLLCGQIFAKCDTLSTYDIEKLFKQNVPTKMFFSHVPRGLVVSFDMDTFFDLNNEKIKCESLCILNKIGNVINQLDYNVVVEGHSQNDFLQNYLSMENWEISLVRANNITKYLMRYVNVSPQKIFTVGFGEFMPFSKKIIDNRKLDSRIDFVILDYEAKR